MRRQEVEQVTKDFVSDVQGKRAWIDSRIPSSVGGGSSLGSGLSC